MAIFSYNAGIITRSKKGADGSRVEKRSAVAAAAYIAGEKLVQLLGRNPFGKDDEEKAMEIRKVHNYTPRTSDVAYKEIFAPEGAAAWVYDREALWNKVENTEKRVDAQLCRSINCALPRELSHEERMEVMKAFVQEAFTSRGMVADVSFHYDEDNHNPHAHIMLTMRRLEGDGFAGVKCKEWQPDFGKHAGGVSVGKNILKDEGEAWSRHCNAALEAAGHSERIDHRSFKERGIDRTPGVHMGKAHYIERKGIPTLLAAEAKVIEVFNQLKAAAKRLSGGSKKHVYAVQDENAPHRSLLLPAIQEVWNKALDAIHWLTGIERVPKHHDDREMER